MFHLFQFKPANWILNRVKLYNYDLDFITEPADFEEFVGTNSDATLKADFELKD